MEIFSRALVVSLFFASILYYGGGTNAQAPQLHSTLPRSPVSSGVLMARAIGSGLVQLPVGSAGPFSTESLTCSPAPCTLPNVQASAGGAPVNEDPIAVNPKNTALYHFAEFVVQWTGPGNPPFIIRAELVDNVTTTGFRAVLNAGPPVTGYVLKWRVTS